MRLWEFNEFFCLYIRRRANVSIGAIYFLSNFVHDLDNLDNHMWNFISDYSAVSDNYLWKNTLRLALSVSTKFLLSNTENSTFYIHAFKILIVYMVRILFKCYFTYLY